MILNLMIEMKAKENKPPQKKWWMKWKVGKMDSKFWNIEK